MTTDLESRKLSIIEYLAEVEDESIVQQIEHILKPTIDFWDQITSTEKRSIQKGIDQLDKGERVAYDSYKGKF